LENQASTNSLLKNYFAGKSFHDPYVWHNWKTILQDAQKGCPARPQQAKWRGRTDRTSCEPFARYMDFGERKIPSSASDIREALFGTLSL
jgi:hypothetical protein